MMRRRLFALGMVFLLLAGSGAARMVYVPLDPGTLGGPDIFNQAQRQVAQAAQAAGLDFSPEPRPLPPRVLMPLDTADGAVRNRNGVLFWRGDMLPDQLAPAETGTLVRKRRESAGTWTTLRTIEDHALAANILLAPVARATAHFSLPPTIMETPYQLGFLGPNPVLLVLWRRPQEDTLPLGGAIALPDPPPVLLDALQSLLPPFAAQADWASEFDAFAP